MKIKLLLILTCITLLVFPKPSFGQAPSLGAASSFTLFTSVGAFNALGPSIVTGDVGTNAGLFTGFPPGTITGNIHVEDATSLAAAGDLALAYGTLAAMPCGAVLGVGLGGGQELAPNVYCTGAATTLNGNLTLNGGGDPDALFVIKIDGSFITGNSSNVFLINGASINNVFWWVTGEFVLGDYSAFKGNVIGNGAISLLEGSSLIGRGLTKAGAIAMHTNDLSLGTPPAAEAGADRAICLNESTQIGAAAVIGSTYSWTSVPAGFTSAIADPTVTPLVTTTYTLVETVTATGLTNTHSVVVTVNPLPAAVAGANRTICLNSPTQLGAPAVVGSTYSWTSNPVGFTSNLANPIVTPLLTTTYTLIETTTATGCTNSNSVTVTVNPLPAAVAGLNRTICQNSPTQIGAVAVVGSTYSWTSNPAGYASTEANPIVTPLLTTTYTVVETITASGCSNSNSVTVTVNPLPAAIAGANRAICLNSSTQIGAPEVVGSTYSWTSNPIGYTSNLANPIVTPLLTTTYTLIETTTATGCTNSNSVTVTVNPLPTVFAGNDALICEAGTYTLYGNTATNAVSTLWTTSGTGTFDNAAALHPIYMPSASDILTGAVTLTFTVTPLAPCVAISDAMVLTIARRSVIYAGLDASSCASSATYAITGATGQNATSYLWTTSGSGTFVNATLLNPVYTPSAADFAAGSVTLTLTGISSATCGNTVDQMLLTFIHCLPSGYNISKSALETSYSAVGEIIHYTITVSNKGSETIYNSTVTDPNAVFSSGNQISILKSNTVATFLAAHTITQADIDAGQVINCAFVSGTFADGVPITGASPCITTTGVQRPQITATKFASETTFHAAGDVIHYSIEVFNCGTVTISNLTVTDPRVTFTQGNVIASVAPATTQSVNAIYVVTPADMTAGRIANIAIVSGYDPISHPISIPSNELILYANDQPLRLSVSKIALENRFMAVGETLNYEIMVTNYRDVVLSDISVSDSSSVVTEGSPIVLLNSGQSATVKATHVITQADLNAGKVVSRATASTTDTWLITETAYSNELTVFAMQGPELLVSSATGVTSYSTIGDQIDYVHQITNTGNVKISGITLSDPQGTQTGNISIADLNPGSSVSVMTSYKITQSDLDAGRLEKTARISGFDQNNRLIQSRGNSISIKGSQIASLTTTLTAAEKSFSTIGEVIHYTVEAFNTGNVTLTDLILSGQESDLNKGNSISELMPGLRAKINAEHVVNASDLLAGKVMNLATIRAYDRIGQQITGTSNELTIQVQSTETLAVAMTAAETSYGSIGEAIHYTLTVKNNSKLPASNIMVTDPNDILSGSSMIESLPTGGSATLPAIHIVTQADLDGGVVLANPSITGEYSDGSTFIESSNPVTVFARKMAQLITMVETTETGFKVAGDLIHYAIEVKNTGNQSLTGIALADRGNLTFSGNPVLSLNPGETANLTAVYTVTLADVDAGLVVMSFNASALAPDQQSVIASSNELSVSALQNPELSTDTHAVESTFTKVGEVIHYTIRVQNSGNVTLISTAVKDPDAVIISARPITTMLPGESADILASHIITQADMDAGMVVSTATAEGFDLKGNTITKKGNTVTIIGQQQPELSAVTSASASTYRNEGDVILYSVVVTNTGNVRMNDITISYEPSTLDLGSSFASLAPGESATVSAEYRVTANDVIAGKIVTPGMAYGYTLNAQKFSYLGNEITLRLVVENYNLANFPNPFSYETTIMFDLPEKGEVILKIYDITGSEVGQIDRREYNEGRNFILWKTPNTQKGLYILKMYYKGEQAIKRMTIIN